MNEFLFFFHIFLVLSFTLLALRGGKETLLALVALGPVLANLFVLKQIELFSLTVTCSDVFVIAGMLGLNLLQEYFGKEAAQKGMKISFYSLIFFAVCASIHLLYTPSPSDTTHEAFVAILSTTPRLIFASFTAYFLVQKWDIYFFQWLQKRLGTERLTLRVWVSLLISQGLDTVLFTFLGLYGTVESVRDILIMSYVVKCGVIALSTPLVALSRRVYGRI